MWEPRRLTTLWAFMACYRDSFTFTYLILSSHLCACLPNGSFPWVLPPTPWNVYAFLVSRMCVNVNVMNLIIFFDGYKLRRTSLFRRVHVSGTSSLLGPMLRSKSCSQIFCLILYFNLNNVLTKLPYSSFIFPLQLISCVTQMTETFNRWHQVNFN
jgi:hypothetical protein